MTDQIGGPIAIARSIAGGYSAGGGTKWEEFEMKFNPGFSQGIELTGTTKSILMTAFAMWVSVRYEINKFKVYLKKHF